MKNLEKLTIFELEEWQAKLKSAGNVKEWKMIGAQFRDKYELTDMQAIYLLRGDKTVTEILNES